MSTSELEKLLRQLLPPERIKTRYIDRVSYGADAGFYFLLPQAVVIPQSEQEIVLLFSFSHKHGIPLVFRTGGTSLSGQSITDGILVDLSRYWNNISVEESGHLVRVQPGITGAMVNARLKRFGRKIGPDPSSISAAMMGGILSNNSSGMCCGVALNAYHTTRYIKLILPDGRVFSTERSEDYNKFSQECATVSDELGAIRNEILSNRTLHDRIRNKYITKNTVGYSLNAFIDFEHPLDILSHLLIGAEGTLAFIAEAVLQTVPDYAYKSTALLYFPDVYSACQAITPLRDSGAEAVELMDRASLHSVEDMPGMPADVKHLPANAAALLVEFQENSSQLLQKKVDRFLEYVPRLKLLSKPLFTTDAEEQAFLWKVRKGLFPAVGAVRRSGTTVILEDVAFPVHQLGDAIVDLHELFARFHYHNAIIFGHAKDGNIHFVVTQSFNDQSEIERYDKFIREVVELVVKKYDGTLKAEHGTGRNMAPFVETEWGGDAYRLMERIKKVIDPHDLLNPGVIINSDRQVHIHNLKSLPTVEQEVDRCIECGYCEHRCPSRDLTTTPRRRIIIRRELERLKESGDAVTLRQLLKDYQYDGIETCAVDGLCAGACPVYINTGDLIKRLRRENHSARANGMALLAAKNFSLLERLAGAGVYSGHLINRIFGRGAMNRTTAVIKTVVPAFPLWSSRTGKPPKLVKTGSNAVPDENAHIIYFPACISRLMGSGAEGKPGIMETFADVCRKTGITFTIPEPLTGSCCGQIFSSKGFSDAYRYTANRIVEKLWNVSSEGKWPVVTDVSSCAYTLHHLRGALSDGNQQKFDRLRILDSVDFLHDMVLPRVKNPTKKPSVVLHPVCSLEKMGIEKKFSAIARSFAEQVDVPLSAGCCGMAGDRGFLFPELTASATHHEAAEVRKRTYDGYYSSTKTCEMAMSEAVKANYESILYLVNDGLLA